MESRRSYHPITPSPLARHVTSASEVYYDPYAPPPLKRKRQKFTIRLKQLPRARAESITEHSVTTSSRAQDKSHAEESGTATSRQPSIIREAPPPSIIASSSLALAATPTSFEFGFQRSHRDIIGAPIPLLVANIDPKLSAPDFQRQDSHQQPALEPPTGDSKDGKAANSRSKAEDVHSSLAALLKHRDRRQTQHSNGHDKDYWKVHAQISALAAPLANAPETETMANSTEVRLGGDDTDADLQSSARKRTNDLQVAEHRQKDSAMETVRDRAWKRRRIDSTIGEGDGQLDSVANGGSQNLRSGEHRQLEGQ